MTTSLKDFESVFALLIKDLNAHCVAHNLPTNALEWFQHSLTYNTLGGKCNRGLSVPDTVSLLLSDPTATTPSSAHFHPASTLGWLVELLQAFFLVSDDMMDHSHTRRGQACWYLRREVGNIAINDAFMLESSIYILLKRHFRPHADYLAMLELFLDVDFRTEMGQQCDLLTAPEDRVDLGDFSMQKYTFIVKYKTAYYSFYLPVALALHYCGKATRRNLEQAEEILIAMGEYFQVQDDYLDCFADPETLGKIGTDIQDNKCSWLVNQALKKVDARQRKVLDDNYGRKDGECERKVKVVYKELELEEDYRRYEEEVVGTIRKRIEEVDESEGLKREVFEAFLKKIYKRSK
ncbi:MAG: Farnesyl pyrophosphate synthetase [Chrysothrix sp. TS-e1954]|nr:MAG: Farnesyl pyrophosphate synthetase [Chrysothrix sp. TS-e1954]